MPEYDLITDYEPDRSLDTIKTLGRLLDDLERVRIMNSNRIGALERTYGEALPHLEAIQEPVATAEHLAELELVRTWRRHPLAPWAAKVKGLGEKSMARLIAEIGDPSVGTLGHWEGPSNGAMPETRTQTVDASDGAIVKAVFQTAYAPEDDEANEVTDTDGSSASGRQWIVDAYYNRGVAQLWSYCGVGDPARSKIPKGAVQAELLARGKPRAKKQLYLIGTGLLKSGIRSKEPVTEWGELYVRMREKYADRIHIDACPPCHAKAGQAWRPGHQHMAALRKMEKELLKAMWRESRRLRGLGYE